MTSYRLFLIVFFLACLRQLLTHTSGLKDWETEGLLDFHREYIDAEYIALMSPFALDFNPGERVQPSPGDSPAPRERLRGRGRPLSKGDNIDRGDAVNKVATRVASFFVPGLEE